MSDECHCCDSPGDLWVSVDCDCGCHVWQPYDDEDDDY